MAGLILVVECPNITPKMLAIILNAGVNADLHYSCLSEIRDKLTLSLHRLERSSSLWPWISAPQHRASPKAHRLDMSWQNSLWLICVVRDLRILLLF